MILIQSGFHDDHNSASRQTIVHPREGSHPLWQFPLVKGGGPASGRSAVEGSLEDTELRRGWHLAAAWVGDMIAIWIEVDFSHNEKCMSLKT